MCPPECRTVTIHVDVFGRAHRPSPTVASQMATCVHPRVNPCNPRFFNTLLYPYYLQQSSGREMM